LNVIARLDIGQNRLVPAERKTTGSVKSRPAGGQSP
jgi:hypothetical protein